MMKNKSAGLVVLLCAIMMAMFQLPHVIAQSQTEKDIDMKKVERFIGEIGKCIESNPEALFQDDNQEGNEIIEIINSINLNDDEYLEVQKIISEQIDIRYYASGGAAYSDTQLDTSNYIKYLIFHISMHYPLGQWKKNMTVEEIIMTRIMPVIKNPNLNDHIKTTWVIELDYLLRSLSSRPITVRNCETVMDELIEIFSDKQKPLNFRVYSVSAWTAGETRKARKSDGLDILVNDDELFEKVGLSLDMLDRTNSPYPQLYSKVLNILENREKYSDKTIKGALDFCGSNRFTYNADRRDLLKKVLKNNAEKEKASVTKNQYKKMLDIIEENERTGKYK